MANKEQVFTIEVKVDGVLVEKFEFTTDGKRDKVGAFWEFLRNVRSHMGWWSFGNFFK